jgi:ribosomal protein S18 acetylase RimI-like enzyme
MGVTVEPLSSRDRDAVHDILRACGAFSEEEVRVALEMLDAGLAAGDYHLLGARVGGVLHGYACIGHAPLTASSWYLYWICVHPKQQRAGVARMLQAHVEKFVAMLGGDRLVLETSGRADYERARQFYRSAGFSHVGTIPNFYRPGDDCLLYCKSLHSGDERT